MELTLFNSEGNDVPFQFHHVLRRDRAAFST
jgi:hypothetical protein